MKTRILILGGGFAGVKCALELSKQSLGDVQIRLISDRSNFEYHGALYRLVAGHSPLEVCMPLRDILDESRVEIIRDRVASIDIVNKVVTGESGSTYEHDILVYTLGADLNYFNIPGLQEHTMGLNTIDGALRLRKKLLETLGLDTQHPPINISPQVRITIIGAGPMGVELAGELAWYLKDIAAHHTIGIDDVSVHLIERSNRILPRLHSRLSKKVSKKLTQLGVHIRTGCEVQSMRDDAVVLSDETMVSSIVIWTAGVQANILSGSLQVEQDTLGRILVDEHLQIPGWNHVFVGGDSAATPHSGMAQTAIADGRYIADYITRSLTDREHTQKEYTPINPLYSIPAGPLWAGTQWGRIRMYGYAGWILRRLVDWTIFINLLSFSQAFRAFRAHYYTCKKIL